MARRKSYEEKVAEHIAAVVEDRQIEHVLHFTRLENLPFILQHGLRSRSELVDADFLVCPSARNRMDDEDCAASVSISCYYPKMFAAKRQAAGEASWIFLFLDPSLLWALPCRFHAQGVATNAVGQEIGAKNGGWALQRLFAESSIGSGGEGLRAKVGLPTSFPTFASAEVQVMNAIHPDYIRGVWGETCEIRDEAEAILDAAGRGECETCIHPFQPRIVSMPYLWG